MRLFRKEFFWIFCCLFLWSGIVNFVVADTQRVIDYSYDGAGNIISTRSGVNLSPPDITSLNPAFVNINGGSLVTATGSDLFGAKITSMDPGLSISNVVTSNTSVIFFIIANNDATIGSTTLTFTTRLGSDSESFTVAEQLASLVPQPDPISVAPDGESNQIKLLFDEPRATEEIYTVSITDTSIATVAQSSITIPQGSSEVTLDITGLLIGNTELKLEDPAQFSLFSFPVYVADKFIGDGETFSIPVGITVGAEDQSGINNNPVLSSAVGITVGSEDPSGINNNPVLSSAVGITVGGEDPSGDLNNLILSMTTGLVVGAVLDSIQPGSLSPGTSVNFIISGFDLGGVDSIVIEPADDLTLSGLSINPEGTEITFSIDADAAAQSGIRTIVVSSSSSEIETLTGAPLELVVQ